MYSWCLWSAVLAIGTTRVLGFAQQTVLDAALSATQNDPAASSSNQQPARCDDVEDRQVRRFAASPDLLQTLRRLDVDIWSATPTHIDAYVPSCRAAADELNAYAYELLPIPWSEVPKPGQGLQTGRPPVATEAVSEHFNLTLLSHPFHSQYHDARNITVFLESLAHTFPDTVSLVHVGHSYEGRPITGVKIAKRTPPKRGDKPRNGFIILASQHARDWIASSTALYLAHALAVHKEDQPHEEQSHVLAHLLNEFEFHILPLPNPDGHEYTKTTDRLWYKNRQTVSHNGNTVCKGIDMNRNWGFEWLPANDPSSNPCSHWYPGSRAFESHEVNAIASYLTYRTGAKVSVFLDLRSYGQMISAPYSYSCDILPRDAEDIIEAALGAAQASSRVHGMFFSTGRLCETLYSAPGNVIDWTYSVEDIKYSYAAHLRDTGTYGFLVPDHWIRPSGEETAALVNYLANFVYKDPKTT